MEKKDFR